MTNTIYQGDNLYILHGMDSETVDLIYLDPPFNSKRLYKAPTGSKAAGASFKDMWTWQDVDESYLDQLVEDYPYLVQFIQSVEIIHGKPMMAYLVYMTQRLIEMRRVLKPTGSIYLHCDPTASHYLKIVMDRIFGKANFRNEVVWKRTASHNSAKRWGPVHDIILYYAGRDGGWNRVMQPLDRDYVDRFYRHSDEKGRYQAVDLTGAGLRDGDTGQPWRDVNPSDSGRHWAVPHAHAIPNEVALPDDYSAMTARQRLEVLDFHGLIYWPPTGRKPRFKRYLSVVSGSPITDVVTDIPPLSAAAKEKTGYPTQKPLALLNRIIEASSNPGDLVLDPFCGCATTCVAAQHLQRNWIGIDISEKAAELVVDRLSDESGLFTDFVHLDRPPVRTDLEQCQPDQDTKTRLYRDQDGKCNACGVEQDIWHFEIDHIIPRSKNGGDYYENYQLLCGHCNRTKGNRPMEYLRAKIKRRNEALNLKVSF